MTSDDALPALNTDALALFHRVDAEVAVDPVVRSSDRALLRYLAMRTVGLHTTGFSDPEQVPWCPDREALRHWCGLHRLDQDCQRVVDGWMNVDLPAVPPPSGPDVPDSPAMVQRWATVHGILLAAHTTFTIGPTFESARFTSTLEQESRYCWTAEETMGASSMGRSFLNPVAAARWLLAGHPGIDGDLMHPDLLQCPDTGVWIEINGRGTSRWAQTVLTKVEKAELTLVAMTVTPSHIPRTIHRL